MTSTHKNRNLLFCGFIVLISLISVVAITEIIIRSVYYQLNAPYAFGIYHFYANKLLPLFETAAGPVGVDLNKKAWEATYTERSMPVPASGPREGYWGVRIRPKNYGNCGYLRYCEAERNIPGLIEFDQQGMQHAGARDRSDLHILFVGGSVAAGAYASSAESTYFERLQRALERRSVKAYISVLAAGGWVSGDEVAAFAERGLKLKPDIVIFLNGLNDLIVEEFPVGHMDLPERIKYYLRNMMTAGELANGYGTTIVYALQPSLPSKKHKTDLEKIILRTAFSRPAHRCQKPMNTHPDYEPMRQGLHRVAEDIGGHFIDLSNIFDDEVPTTFADAYHFSDPGHELLADALAQAILPLLK